MSGSCTTRCAGCFSRGWSGDDLARRLGITSRTVRRDIDRLRELDYPI
ncbi:helix-turn-helix domain-containing protein, partial [Streptomyces niveus]